MCFHLSGRMINWWTHRSPLAFSYTALYPSFPVFDCLVDLYFFLWLVRKVKQTPNLLFPHPFGSFFFVQTRLFFSLSSFFFSRPPALLSVYGPSLPPCCPFPPIFHCSLSPRVWFLGYALLTHSDSPAVWTPCLPTDNHMLPQYSSGKLSIYSLNLQNPMTFFFFLICYWTRMFVPLILLLQSKSKMHQAKSVLFV